MHNTTDPVAERPVRDVEDRPLDSIRHQHRTLTLDGLNKMIRDFYRGLCPHGHDWVWFAGWVQCRRCQITQRSILQPGAQE